MWKSKCEIDGDGAGPRSTHRDSAFRISHSALRQPSTSEPSLLEPTNDVSIPAHHAPYEIGAVVLDHRQNRPLIDAEVVDIEPAERRIDGAGLLLAGGGERGIEGVEEAVRREQLGAVRRAHREQRGDSDLGREWHGAADGGRADGAVVALVAERRAAGVVGMELAAGAPDRERLVGRSVTRRESPDIRGVAAPSAGIRDGVPSL